MSLELFTKERDALNALWSLWAKTPDTELEATFPKLDYTRFSDAIQHLRSLGLKEEPQEVKLNISLPSGLRFTLVGEAVIQAYCKDNAIQGKPFHVILKDKHIVGATEADLPEYGVRVKLRREFVVPLDDPRVAHALAKWSSTPKTFRYMTRFRFTSTKYLGIVFDASFVKSNPTDKRGSYIPSTTFLGAGITRQPIQYELEVEATAGAPQASLLTGIVAVLRGIQKSHVLVRRSVRDDILAVLYNQTRTPRGKFPGPKSVTLRREHMAIDVEPDTPNIRTGDYNVTDKADGTRALLVVAKDGRIYLADKNETVYGTDRRLDAAAAADWAGAILDGEWVHQDKDNKPMSHFYAFDIFNGLKGADMTDRPFLLRTPTAATRLAALTEAIGVLGNAGRSVGHIPDAHSLKISMKTFQTPGDPADPLGIFHVAAETLDRVAASAPYHTDGLIFTPNASPMHKFGAWYSQLKWKPAHQNSIDFLVITEKTRDDRGKPTLTDLIEPKDHDGGVAHVKTLRLLVASADDPALEDPRDTILFKKPYVPGQRGTYRPTLFSPSPPDPMAAVCYVAINSGASSASGAAAAMAPLKLGNVDDTIRCVETGDPIKTHMIVEMVYHPERDAGWRWEPMRIRWDKTEQFANGDVGSMNNEAVANDIWTSIHEPVTELMIRTGAVTEIQLESTGVAAGSTTYYQRRPSQRDQHKARGHNDFHNKYIKNQLLLSKAIKPGCHLLDMSVGQGGDLHKWIQGRVGFVLGCDIALTGLTDKVNGAYRRYLDQKSRQPRIAPMIFVQADSTKSYADGAAGITPLDRSILRSLWGENEERAPPLAQELRGIVSRDRFDVASLMFTLHYFFQDVASLDGWLRNLSDTVKVGGTFVGCCFDGDAVSTLLRDLAKGEVKRGVEGESDVWTIKKQYDEPEGMLPATELGLGRAIDVNFISIGAAHTEYLVSFPYFQRRMADFGFELLNAEELSAIGLRESTNMFSASYDMATASGYTYPMSPTMKMFSFLNRWFMFRRRHTGRGASRNNSKALVSESVSESKEEEPNRPDLATVANVLADVATTVEPVGTTETTVAANAANAAPVLELLEPEGVALPLREAEEAVAAEETAVAAVAAAGGAGEKAAPKTLFPFYHKSAAKDDFKQKDKHWRRVLSTYAPFEFKDKDKADVVYPTLEAVLGSEKYKIATNRPELGPQIFGTLGNIHQMFAPRLAALETIEEMSSLLEDQGSAQRDAQKPGEIKTTGAKWNTKKWDTDAINAVLQTYLRQRLERDEHFRRILRAVKTANGSLVYVGGGGELGGKIVGDEVKGENLYGEALNAVMATL